MSCTACRQTLGLFKKAGKSVTCPVCCFTFCAICLNRGTAGRCRECTELAQARSGPAVVPLRDLDLDRRLATIAPARAATLGINVQEVLQYDQAHSLRTFCAPGLAQAPTTTTPLVIAIAQTHARTIAPPVADPISTVAAAAIPCLNFEQRLANLREPSHVIVPNSHVTAPSSAASCKASSAGAVPEAIKTPTNIQALLTFTLSFSAAIGRPATPSS